MSDPEIISRESPATLSGTASFSEDPEHNPPSSLLSLELQLALNKVNQLFYRKLNWYV